MSNYILAYNQILPSIFEDKQVSKIEPTSFKSGKLDLDQSSEYFPDRSDLKIMREDIIGTILSLKSLLNENGFSSENIEQMPFFVANGAFVDQPEKHLQRMPQIYSQFTPEMDNEERKKKIYRMSPPLLALETLTNSSMSFTAQYVGFKSQNATFGNTSYAAIQALQQAQIELTKKMNQVVVVSTANCADTYSFLTNSGVVGYSDSWFESAAVANLLLLNSELKPNGAVCKLSTVKNYHKIPDLASQKINNTWQELLPEKPADLIVFSGAFCQQRQKLDEKYLRDLGFPVKSLFERYGNLGASNLSTGIIEGIKQLNNDIKLVDIVDRDIYGRESLVRIEAC